VILAWCRDATSIDPVPPPWSTLVVTFSIAAWWASNYRSHFVRWWEYVLPLKELMSFFLSNGFIDVVLPLISQMHKF
jgi:hypothetical protein